MLSINSHSLSKKYAELHAYLSLIASRFIFIVVVETWLTEFRDKALEIQGYKSHAIYRLNQTSGGIKLYYRDHLTLNVIDQFTGIFDSCQCITAKASIREFGTINIIYVYRPPCKPLTHFENYINSVLEYIGNNAYLLNAVRRKVRRCRPSPLLFIDVSADGSGDQSVSRTRVHKCRTGNAVPAVGLVVDVSFYVALPQLDHSLHRSSQLQRRKLISMRLCSQRDAPGSLHRYRPFSYERLSHICAVSSADQRSSTHG